MLSSIPARQCRTRIHTHTGLGGCHTPQQHWADKLELVDQGSQSHCCQLSPSRIPPWPHDASAMKSFKLKYPLPLKDIKQICSVVLYFELLKRQARRLIFCVEHQKPP